MIEFSLRVSIEKLIAVTTQATLSSMGSVCNSGRLTNRTEVWSGTSSRKIVSEITIAWKKILLLAVYRTHSQNSEQFENLVERLQTTLDLLRRERPYTLWRKIPTADHLSGEQRISKDLKGFLLEEGRYIEPNNLCQFVDEPTNMRGEGMSCIDLITTD